MKSRLALALAALILTVPAAAFAAGPPSGHAGPAPTQDHAPQAHVHSVPSHR